ncbi:hypothetical protein [Lacrimispora sp.]|uniref:hypothetical protein n=1 Tax=Lacrimispora sp. TaxID=2719234 RepID=UPI0028ACA8FD|nr:hypothetical protein [Lacrimispora sp.]
MKKYLVSFMKKGELFEVVKNAYDSYEARKIVSIENNIPMNFEIGKCEDEDNHVGAVIEL